MSFDKSKPYGNIYGAANGASFEQDGLYYDGDEVLIGDAPPAKAGKAAKAAPVVAPAKVGVSATVVAKAPAPADAQLSAQLAS